MAVGNTLCPVYDGMLGVEIGVGNLEWDEERRRAWSDWWAYDPDPVDQPTSLHYEDVAQVVPLGYLL